MGKFTAKVYAGTIERVEYYVLEVPDGLLEKHDRSEVTLSYIMERLEDYINNPWTGSSCSVRGSVLEHWKLVSDLHLEVIDMFVHKLHVNL
jgi:hypothetical protein